MQVKHGLVFFKACTATSKPVWQVGRSGSLHPATLASLHTDHFGRRKWCSALATLPGKLRRRRANNESKISLICVHSSLAEGPMQYLASITCSGPSLAQTVVVVVVNAVSLSLPRAPLSPTKATHLSIGRASGPERSTAKWKIPVNKNGQVLLKIVVRRRRKLIRQKSRLFAVSFEQHFVKVWKIFSLNRISSAHPDKLLSRSRKLVNFGDPFAAFPATLSMESDRIMKIGSVPRPFPDSEGPNRKLFCHHFRFKISSFFEMSV